MERSLENAVQDNLNGLTEFCCRVLAGTPAGTGKGMWIPRIDGERVTLERAALPPPSRRFIYIGGEVPNSITPLYEASYFFKAWFLAAVGTVALRVLPLDASRDDVQRFLRVLAGADILQALRAPEIGIVSGLDTDIEPYRYVKHGLWRLNPECFSLRCVSIQPAHLDGRIDSAFSELYAADVDRELASAAVCSGASLPHMKGMIYAAAIRRLVAPFGVEIESIPLYFHFSPEEELREEGADSLFTSLLCELHASPAARRELRALTGAHRPWIFKLGCPCCGEQSKRVIHAAIKSGGRQIRHVCSSNEKRFLNEAGMTVVRRGCGHSWDVDVPTSGADMHRLLVESSATINFAVRQLMTVLRPAAFHPICWPVTEVGLRESGRFVGAQGAKSQSMPLPAGYGDHLQLLQSMVTLQSRLIDGVVVGRPYPTVRSPMLVLAHGRENLMVDHSIRAKGSNLPITDSSVFKLMERGVSAEELLFRSLDFMVLPRMNGRASGDEKACGLLRLARAG